MQSQEIKEEKGSTADCRPEYCLEGFCFRRENCLVYFTNIFRRRTRRDLMTLYSTWVDRKGLRARLVLAASVLDWPARDARESERDGGMDSKELISPP